MASSILTISIINMISLSCGAEACFNIAYQTAVCAEVTGYVLISNRTNQVVA